EPGRRPDGRRAGRGGSAHRRRRRRRGPRRGGRTGRRGYPRPRGGRTGANRRRIAVTAKNIRAALAADPDLGAGNVLPKLLEHGADPDGPGMTFDVAVDGLPAWEPLTLGTLYDRVAARAAWLHRYGIRPRDPVAVYATTAADCFLTFMALNCLGAIPALMNPNIAGEVAAGYIRRLRGVGVLTDAAHAD